jgi:beta-glucosidase-like glycosyl hydrolase
MKYINGLAPFIFGISQDILTDEEREFIKLFKPCGIILFSRNLKSIDQIKELNNEIHALVDGIKIFIDQEGGRVQRIKPPIGLVKYKTQKYFGDLYNVQRELAIKELQQNYLNLSSELKNLGFDVTCAPVCDLYHNFANESIMGDRTFSSDPDIVTKLSIEALSAMKANSIEGVIKHIPGHGRSITDSHKGLTIIKGSLDELLKSDFKVFKDLAEIDYIEYAMTGHCIYPCLDQDLPATISPKVISFIKEEIGFKKLIMTDDICMKALEGDLLEIAQQSFNAGCDIVLHCSGKIEDMKALAQHIYDL